MSRFSRLRAANRGLKEIEKDEGIPPSIPRKKQCKDLREDPLDDDQTSLSVVHQTENLTHSESTEQWSGQLRKFSHCENLRKC